MGKVGRIWKIVAQVCLGIVLMSPAVFALTAIEQRAAIHGDSPETDKHGGGVDARNSAELDAATGVLGGLPTAPSPLPPTPDVQAGINARLTEKVRRVLDSYYLRPLNTRDDAPWSVLHWSIAYGVDATVCVGDPSGPRVSAIDWLCSNNPSAGKQLMSPRGNGMTLPIAPGLEGHDGQFLSMLAQSKVNRGPPATRWRPQTVGRRSCRT